MSPQSREVCLHGQRACAFGIRRGGFTLIELLVVISIISMVMAVSVPALSRVRQQARVMLGMNNQKQITAAVNVLAADNNARYPESVATVGFGKIWNWSDPTKLTGNRRRSPGLHRAVSEYLRDYVADASIMYCPSAPRRYTYLQEAWDAGDAWDNPETAFPSESVTAMSDSRTLPALLTT